MCVLGVLGSLAGVSSIFAGIVIMDLPVCGILTVLMCLTRF